MKDQVNIELEALDNIQVPAHGPQHALHKRSVAAQKVHHHRKRSLEAIKEQITGELEVLEEGEYTGEVQEVYDRKRRMVNGKELLENPKVQKTELNEKAAVPIEKGHNKAKGETRAKRSLKGSKGEDWHEECWEEPRERCSSVPQQHCSPVTEEVCKDIPKEICENVEHCKDIPKKDCHVDYKEVCANIPSRQCHPEEHEICKEVPSKVCHDVPHEVCVPFPGKKCEKILVKRPRTVCPPPQRVRVLDVPEGPPVSAPVHSSHGSQHDSVHSSHGSQHDSVHSSHGSQHDSVHKSERGF